MGNFIDLTGKKFGRLTVIRRAFTGRPGTFWECLCDCGKTKIANGLLLRDGKTKSCGCLKEETQRRIRDDLTGKRFGRLVVQHAVKKKKPGITYWHCLCDCGNEVDVAASALKNGDTRSCGCLAKEKQREIGASSKGRPSKRLKDLTGRRFGRLTVLSRAENSGSGKARWLCRCDCGKRTVVLGSHLNDGHTQSCGCLGLEHATEAKIKHGESKTRLYRIFLAMHNRCERPSVKAYERYGGRGIRVCDEWKNYEAFASWAHANGYKEELSIDRIDNDNGYSPENCEWITRSENSRRMHAYYRALKAKQTSQ